MQTRTLLVATTALLASCTCLQAPTVEGTVVDLWGQPIEGVAVAMEGVPEPVITDVAGRFSLPIAAQVALHLEGAGIIPQDTDLVPPSVDTTYEATVEVIPEPQVPGFHLVGPSSYVLLPGEPVVRVGNELRTWQGLRSSGEVEVGGTPFRVVFHTPLKRDEVARLDIELHRLEFIETTEVATVDGQQEVDVNLWTSAGKVKYAKTPLGNAANYLLRVDDLPAGTWAFGSMGLLDPKDAHAYEKAAPTIRKVHPFTVR